MKKADRKEGVKPLHRDLFLRMNEYLSLVGHGNRAVEYRGELKNQKIR